MKDAEWAGLATAIVVLVVAVASLWWAILPGSFEPMRP